MRNLLILLSFLLVFLVFLPLPGGSRGQTISPESREELMKIVQDRRFSQEKFMRGLKPTASLKSRLVSEALIDHVNYIYGWTLDASGHFTVEQVSDIMYEIVLSSRYNEAVFLSSVRVGAPLLKDLRARHCVVEFNKKFKAGVPLTGGLSIKEAERLLYDILGQQSFNSNNVLSKLCEASADNSSNPPTQLIAESEAPPAAQTAPAKKSATGMSRQMIIVIGGIVILVLIVITGLRVFVQIRRAAR